MREQNQRRPAGCATVWFGGAVIWLFIFAHIFDDVRHGTENLLLLVVIPFLIVAASLSVWAGRWFWHQFPHLSPRRLHAKSSFLPVLIGFLLSLMAAFLWAKSPLFTWFYDSCKIILLIVLSGLILGFVYQTGGRVSVLLSLFSGALSAITAFLSFLAMGLIFGGTKDLLSGVLSFASIGIPYVIAVVLYDCYRKTTTMC